jgi:hypothetical protein
MVSGFMPSIVPSAAIGVYRPKVVAAVAESYCVGLPVPVLVEVSDGGAGAGEGAAGDAAGDGAGGAAGVLEGAAQVRATTTATTATRAIHGHGDAVPAGGAGAGGAAGGRYSSSRVWLCTTSSSLFSRSRVAASSVRVRSSSAWAAASSACSRTVSTSVTDAVTGCLRLSPVTVSAATGAAGVRSSGQTRISSEVSTCFWPSGPTVAEMRPSLT